MTFKANSLVEIVQVCWPCYKNLCRTNAVLKPLNCAVIYNDAAQCTTLKHFYTHYIVQQPEKFISRE